MLLRRKRVDLTAGLPEKQAFFVRWMAVGYRLALLGGFYLLFFSALVPFDLLGRALVFVLGLWLVLSCRTVARAGGEALTRWRHGALTDAERDAIAAHLERINAKPAEKSPAGPEDGSAPGKGDSTDR